MLILPQDSLFTNPLELLYTCEAELDFHRRVSFLSFHAGMFQTTSQTELRKRTSIIALIQTLILAQTKKHISVCSSESG